MNSVVRISGCIHESITDGPGIRLAIFCQGCLHACIHCHNPETHDVLGGELVTIDTLLASLDTNPLLDGITITGGEPLLQVQALTLLVERVHKKKPKEDFDIILYTGFIWEKIMTDKSKYISLFERIDYLVDGPFIQSLKSYKFEFRGSSNQRIIDVQKSLLENNTYVLDTFPRKKVCV